MKQTTHDQAVLCKYTRGFYYVWKKECAVASDNAGQVCSASYLSGRYVLRYASFGGKMILIQSTNRWVKYGDIIICLGSNNVS